jgi:hypothetical protein
MPIVTTVAGRPISGAGASRVLFGLLGGAIAASAVFFAWIMAAGVETSPSNFYSGPSLSSLLLLLLAVAVLILGAAVVAVYGSIYGTASDPARGPTEGRAVRQGWSAGREAVFFGVFGIGLLLMGLSLPVANPGSSHALTPPYISPTVLFIPETVDGVAVGALALGIALFALGRKRDRPEFRAWWRRTGRYVTVTGAVVFVVVTALLVVPVHQTFSTQFVIEGGNGGGITDELLPTGVIVTGSWSTIPEGSVNFTIQGGTSSGNVYAVNASSGTFAFTTTGDPWALYLFSGNSENPETVTVSGSFTAPTWQWAPGEPGEPTALPAI